MESCDDLFVYVCLCFFFTPFALHSAVDSIPVLVSRPIRVLWLRLDFSFLHSFRAFFFICFRPRFARVCACRCAVMASGVRETERCQHKRTRTPTHSPSVERRSQRGKKQLLLLQLPHIVSFPFTLSLYVRVR